MNIRLFTAFIILLLIPLSLQAQEPASFMQQSARYGQQGMWILGSWAVLNIGTGIAGMNLSQGSDRRFYEMNVYWNLVNLGIAAGGAWAMHNLLQTPPAGLDEVSLKHHNLEKIYLFNAGLDLAYMAAGLYMVERSKRPGKWTEHLKGYGQSVIMQGAFLFTFDLVMYLVQADHAKQHLLPLLENLHLSPGQAGLVFHF